MAAGYDALLVVSFGGPEGMDEVMPFLENVLRGRERAAGAAARGGRALRALRRREPDQRAVPRARRGAARGARAPRPPAAGLLGQPPLAPDAGRHAAAHGRRRRAPRARLRRPRPTARTRAAGSTWTTSPARARRSASARRRWTSSGSSTTTPASSSRSWSTWRRPSTGSRPARRAAARLVFTAHSIPRALAATCDYEAQLRETAAPRGLPAGPAASGASSTRAAAGRRASRGSSPTSWTTCAPSPPRGCRTWWWRRSGSSRTTWKCSTTSTSRRRAGRSSSGSTWCARPRWAPTPASCAWSASSWRSGCPTRPCACTSARAGPAPDVCPPGCCPAGRGGP